MKKRKEQKQARCVVLPILFLRIIFLLVVLAILLVRRSINNPRCLLRSGPPSKKTSTEAGELEVANLRIAELEAQVAKVSTC